MNILLHMCCGPCSCYPAKQLRAEGHTITGYFFNPNIHPYKEFSRRLEAAKEFAAKENFPIVADEEYRLREFLVPALQLDAEKERSRCQLCYTWRLRESARFAKAHGFDAFTSSLFVSPYQQHDLMREAAEKISQEEEIPFFYEDFRPGWQEGVEISLALELYRQPYCGCIFSEEERYSKAWKKKQKQKAKEIKNDREDSNHMTT